MDARVVFDPFELDPSRRRLLTAGEPVAISDRQFDVLALLVAQAGRIVGKDDLIQAGWKDVAVGDNSLEQAISGLRRVLGPRSDGSAFIETIPRRGYRFNAPVERLVPRESDESLDAMLAPYRAFVEGRAALESLAADQVARARQVFEDVVLSTPSHAFAHVGLANACVMQFEMTRADSAPDTAALTRGVEHAREACRLDPRSGEAWATLGFLLDRVGRSIDARAAANRGVTLEPDNWRHHFRLAFVSWGEERLRAAHRTTVLLPDFPLAQWLSATVHVARQALPEAERELEVGIASQASAASGSPFSSVALHWMLGLIHLARGDDGRASDHFDRELAREGDDHLYARECASNTWYAIGAMRLRQGRRAEAKAAFEESIARVAHHPLAHIGLLAAAPSQSRSMDADMVAASNRDGTSIDVSICAAARLALTGQHAEAAGLVNDALAAAPAGNAGWVLPIEPLLHVAARPDAWSRTLGRLRSRAV